MTTAAQQARINNLRFTADDLKVIKEALRLLYVRTDNRDQEQHISRLTVKITDALADTQGCICKKGSKFVNLNCKAEAHKE